MKYSMKVIILFFSVVFSFQAFACSFVQMTREFEITGEPSSAPGKPSFKVKDIKRGFYDGNRGSCSDAGIITLESIGPDENVGYIFSIVDGEFEDIIFRDYPIVPSDNLERNEFRFVWFDGHTDNQEPFQITVEITPVSKAGVRGEADRLVVSHPGTKKPWWKFWGQ